MRRDQGLSSPPYPSSLTDSEWQAIEPLLPPAKPGGRNRSVDLRAVIDAIRYKQAQGCPWRALPSTFPPWQTVRHYFYNWQRDGTWSQIRTILQRWPR